MVNVTKCHSQINMYQPMEHPLLHITYDFPQRMHPPPHLMKKGGVEKSFLFWGLEFETLGGT